MAIFKQKPNFISMADILESSSKVLDNNIKSKSKVKNMEPALENKLKDASVKKAKPIRSKVKVETYLGSDITWLNSK